MLIKSLLDTGMSHLSNVTFKLNLHLKLIFQKFQSGSILIVLRIFLIVLIVCVCVYVYLHVHMCVVREQLAGVNSHLLSCRFQETRSTRKA